MLLLATGFSSVSFAQSPSPPAFTAPEQALVVGFNGRYSVTYDHTVVAKDAMSDLKALAKGAGWTPSRVRVTNERGPFAKTLLTSIEFTASALDPRARSFPIEPIILTFRRFRRVGAVFFVPPGYPYWGPLAYETPQVAMRCEPGRGVYTFHFAIKDPQVNAFQLPLKDPASQATPARKSEPRRNETLVRLAFVVALALGAAAIVYGVASLVRDR